MNGQLARHRGLQGELNLRCDVAYERRRAAFAQAAQGHVHGGRHAHGLEGKISAQPLREAENRGGGILG